ncbi:UNVERIFIED_CONTAM: Retrovirus-related Pol polyprotein from transposon RE2 [Sesamum angustifolium]|uniref:Retrovirus-related Pol polyprotein from transposon RE2 n=1 Tax=Sesamum angustifolium TaxID=2727405 RepID=A0AAW2IUG1_9LAMI
MKMAATPSATPSSPGAFIASHSESWVIDSGATSHLTGNRSSFLTFSTSPKFPPVRLADGSYSPISGSGTVQSTAYLNLTNVPFAPKFSVNLLSVSQLTKTHNCSVTFYPSYCVIQDLQTRRMIGTGHERGGLYFLDITPHVDARALFASISPLQWHSRLGHPSLPILHKILPIDSARLECKSCELGKHHRASFPPRVEKRSPSLFTLVHSDIWGPCLFESLRGFRYFITFVDDYSRMTWDYLLKDRSQVPTIITSFYNEIYTQFSVNIRILRTDNVLEFVQKSVSDFCNSKGILHQTSCPYTSQQNGVAECKHRHLLDVARTIMTHMHVPKLYWGDVVLTACYLINRMPSTVLNGDTPYSCLFLDKPLFQSSAVIPPPSVPLPVPTLSVPPHTKPPTRPLQVYYRHNRSTMLIVPPDLPLTAAPGNLSATPANDFLIALRKEDGNGRQNVCSHFKGTWELVEVPLNADIVACRWVFTLKFRADGTLERYKARLVAKGFTQTYGMDIKNTFLYGDLNETVYMEQPPGYVAQGEKQRMVCKLKKAIYGLKQSLEHGMVVLAVYVDDILITGSDIDGIEDAKTYLQKHFVTKDLGRPRPNISFAVGLVSQFMDKPRSVHWEAALRILKHIKTSPVARSSAEAEYRAMAHTTSEILWLKNLLKELGFMYDDPVPMHCDNQATIHIASNPVFHERNKPIKVDFHFVREAILSQKICTPFTPSEQRADIFTKALRSKQFNFLSNKLGMIDIFAPA